MIDFDQLDLVLNEDRKRYELEVEGKKAFIEFIKTNTQIYLTHTEVPQSLEGKGVGSHLVLTVLKQVEQMDLQLVPLCPFVASYIKRHPEWRKLVLRETK